MSCVFREVPYCVSTKRFRHTPEISSMDLQELSVAVEKVKRSLEISSNYLLQGFNKP